MVSMAYRIRKFEFEARIFISMAIAAAVAAFSFTVFARIPSTVVLLGTLGGLSETHSRAAGYIAIATILMTASILRMWAGTVLSAQRVMSFKVQSAKLAIGGPYAVVRNPIYLADLVAMAGFSLCLPPVGIVLPVLFYFHYIQLIKYEESSFVNQLRDDYRRYRAQTPRLLPSRATLARLGDALWDFSISAEGARHNALYALFVIGFIAAAVADNIMLAFIIGIPAVIDWAIVHTKIGVHQHPPKTAAQRPAGIRKAPAQKVVFGDIIYAQCWEDPQIDREAFHIREDDVIFTITSGGCNALTFLLDNPKKVIALDFNQCQNFLLELKIAAFRALSYHEMLEFIGVARSKRRAALYVKVQQHLSQQSRVYWNRQRKKIEKGIIHCGRYERYMALLRRCIYLLMGRRRIEQFFYTPDSDKRRALFEKAWKGFRWTLFTRVLLSRTVMSMLFDKAFFAYLERSFSFGRHFEKRIKAALTELPIEESYFLSYVMFGIYSSRSFPHYLRQENFATIKSRLNRIEIHCGDCEEFLTSVPDNTISKYNFTNIFEWVAPQKYERMLSQAIRAGRDRAIMTYRNLLVRRHRPIRMYSYIVPRHREARRLHARDLSFIYRDYVVEEITK